MRSFSFLLVWVSLGSGVCQPLDKFWSSRECNDCSSTLLPGITTGSGSGLFLEQIDFAGTSGLGFGIVRMHSNFVVVYAATDDFREAVIHDSWINVIARDHSVLRTAPPDNRLPVDIRSTKNKEFTKGVSGGYLFFPYDADACDLEIVVSTKIGVIHFPFSRSILHMDFGDPMVVKSADPPSQPPAIARKPSSEFPLSRATKSTCGDAIETHIDGGFHGWEGETIYRMDNGTVWKQASYHYHYHYAFHPKVFIYRASSGVCHIRVEGDDDTGANIQKLQ
jgi:hypothetical protein